MTEDGGKVRRGTHLFLTAAPEGGLVVEALTPGPLSEREQFLLAELPSRHVAYRALDAFCGPSAVDALARFDIGAALLFFANGFTTEDGGREGRFAPSWDMMLRRRELFDGNDATVRSPAAAAAAAAAQAAERDWRPEWWPFKPKRTEQHARADQAARAQPADADVAASGALPQEALPSAAGPVDETPGAPAGEPGAEDVLDASEAQPSEAEADPAEGAPPAAPPAALASLTFSRFAQQGAWRVQPGAGILSIGRRRRR